MAKRKKQIKKLTKEISKLEKIKIPQLNLLERVLLGILLSLPLLISVGTIISIKISSLAPVVGIKGIQLSPVMNSSSLIRGLTIFSLGYIVFIVLLFYGNIKHFILEHIKQKHKH